VRRLDALIVSRQRQPSLQQRLALLLGVEEVAVQHLGIGVFEIVGRVFLLGLEEDVAIGDAVAVEVQVVDVLDALDVHGQALEAVGQLDRHGIALDAAHLLEVGELGHFHAVAPHFPAQAPGAQGRAFPVILDEADVVRHGIDAQAAQAFQIEFLRVGRRRLQQHLILVVMLQAVGVLAVTAILGTARRLHIGGLPRVRAQRAQRGGRVEGAGADLHVVRLEDDAALLGPEVLERQDQLLEAGLLGAAVAHGFPPFFGWTRIRSANLPSALLPVKSALTTLNARTGRPPYLGTIA